MNRKVILLLIATCIVSYFLFSGLNNIMQKQPLSEADVQQHIENLYAGEVKSIAMEDDIAIVSFATAEGIYQVNVDLENRHPSNLTLVHQFVAQIDEKKEVVTKDNSKSDVVHENTKQVEQKNDTVQKPVEQPKTNEQATKPQTKQPTPENKSYKISQEQAIQIALKEQPGIVDKAKFKKTDDGGTYEIEIEHGDYETKFVIHAITGKIITVEFDD